MNNKDYYNELVKINFGERQSEYQDALKRLANSGKSWKWLHYAIMPKVDAFREKGFGLLFTQSYQNEVDDKIRAEQEKKRMADELWEKNKKGFLLQVYTVAIMNGQFEEAKRHLSEIQELDNVGANAIYIPNSGFFTAIYQHQMDNFIRYLKGKPLVEENPYTMPWEKK